MLAAPITKATFEDPASRIFRLLDAQEERIQRVFLTALRSLKDEISLEDLAALLQQGRVGDALTRLKHAADALAEASNVAFVTAGQSAAEIISTAGLGRIVFDQVNLNAVAAMQRNKLSLIREFTNEQRKAVSSAITAGVEGGANPIAQARNFRDSIGLTNRQWETVARHRADLQRAPFDSDAATRALSRKLRDKRSDKLIRRAIREGKPIPAGKIDSMVTRYADASIRHRAKVIARTEALRAVHQGNEEAYRQAITEEVVKKDQLERTWRTSIDGRERDTHFFLNGEARGWDEPWETVNGVLRYPGDPDAPASETIMCRCAILTRIKS